MHRSLFWSKTISLLLALLLALSPLSFAQDASQTRPRRTQTPQQPAQTGSSGPLETETRRLTTEPVIRIGLATDARSASVSTNGRLLNATESGASPIPLTVARVRLEARLLAPQ